MFNQLRLATGFLTLLPVMPQDKFSEKNFSRSMKFFTLVGFFFGLANVFCLYFHQFHQSRLLTGLLVVLANLFLSGGLHLDGLMDCFDGIAANKKTREETLAVMKDSRVGAFGAMAAVVLIVSKIIFVSEINFMEDSIYYSFVFFITPFLSRFMMVLAVLFQVSEDDVKKDASSLALLKSHEKTWFDFFINLLGLKIPAGIFLLAFPIAFSRLISLDLYLIAWMILAWFVYVWLKFKLKGHNGDSMGAGLEINEALLFFSFIFL